MSGWSNFEKAKFIEGTKIFGYKYKAVSEHIGTKDYKCTLSFAEAQMSKFSMVSKIKKSCQGPEYM